MLLFSRLCSIFALVVLSIVKPCRAADDDPRRPPAIAAQGVPLIPDELAARLAKYDNIRWAMFSGWAPAGNGMLVRTQPGNAAQLFRVFELAGRLEQITFFDEPVSGRFVPKALDGAVLLSFSRGGSENDQIFFLDPAEFISTHLTDGKSRNLLGPSTRDGKYFALGSNRRNGRDTDWYLADSRDPHAQPLLLEVDGQHWYASDFSPDGKQLLLTRYVSANESYPAVLDVAMKKLLPLPLQSKEKVAAYSQLRFAPDGNSIYLTTDARGEFAELARLDLTTEKYEWLSTDIPWDVTDVEVEPTAGTVAFAVNQGGRSALYVIEDGKRRQIKLPVGTIGGLEFSPDRRRLGLTLATATAPADAYSLHLASGELTRWTYSEVGGLNPASFVEPVLIEFPSFDGRPIPAWIYRPKTASKENPAAVLIDIHGGPEGQYRPTFSPSIQFYVNELGLAVICPNVRGSSGYGKTFLKLDDTAKREDSVRDIGALLDWIAKQPDLDAGRVAVSGASYGGYMVLASLVHFGDRLKAGIDVVGIANFITFLERTAAYRRDLRRAEYGDERNPEMRKVFERINPTANVEKIRSALLVAHGRNDPRVPFFEAEQIADKLRTAGRPVWTVYADNEGHGFAKRDNRDYLRAVTALFLERQLGMKKED